MLRLFILILIALLLPIPTFADFYQSIQESKDEYILTLRVDANALKLNHLQNQFTEITLPDAVAIGTPGNPALPTISRFFDVKADQYTATIETSDPITYQGIKVFPIQPDHTENFLPKTFAYNDKVYAKDQNPSVSLGEVASIGNAKALAIRVNPFARHGDTVTLFQTIIIRLKPTADANTNLSKNHFESQFHSHQQKLLISGDKQKEIFSKDFGTVLVLSSLKLLADAQNYAALHPEYNIEVLPLPNGSKFTDVKKIIADRYAQGNLDTVVLYGDEAHVPKAHWGEYDSDSFYQYLDPANTNYTQIAIGRIPAQNHNDAKFYNSKLATYLKNTKLHTSKNIMLVAHNQDYPYKYTANQESIRKAPNPMGFVFHTEYGGAKGTNSKVIQHASNNYPLINYRGHGSDQEWWNWDANNKPFDATQISLLKNLDEKVSVFFNIACETGTFETPKRNMSENLIFLENKGSSPRGGIVVLGATAPSYTAINDRFDIHLFEFMEQKDKLPLGHLIALANDKTVLEQGGGMLDNVQMYVLFGDPLIYLW